MNIGDEDILINGRTLGRVPNAGNVKQITLDPASTSERIKAAQQLFSIEQELKEPISKLSYTAEEAFVSISRIFDNHDQLPQREKALRHVYYDLCKAISSALSPQLVWQTSENLHWRLRGLDDVEADIANPERLSSRLNFVMYYSRDPEPKGIFRLWQKGAPIKGRDLRSSVNLLYSGIAKSEMKEMFIEGLTRSQNFFDQYTTIKPLIEQMLEQLRARVEFDEYLESESKMPDDLYRRYRRLSNKLDVLKGCGMPLIKNIDRRWLFNSFSHLIYMGTILAIISDYEDWGKDSIPY